MVIRRSAKFIGASDIFRDLDSSTLALRVIFIPVRTVCGEPDLSDAFCLVLAVVAEETGCRGRELRSGGDDLGGDDDIYAFRLDLLWAPLSGL